MLKEVQQPNIEVPDRKDPLRLELSARVHTEWIRHVGPQLNINVKNILSDVYWDRFLAMMLIALE